MRLELALCSEDQQKYGGPEWVTFDTAQVDDMPFDELDPLEQQIMAATASKAVPGGKSINRVLATEMFPVPSLLCTKVMLWLARQLDGTGEPDFAGFNIRARKVRSRTPKAGDADPPGQASSSTSAAEETSETPGGS